MSDLLFRLPPAKRPDHITGSAVGDDHHRLELRRRWADGPLAAWLMLNPSRAGATLNDPTLWRVIEFSHAWGYAGAAVVNFGSLRTPDPAQFFEWLKGPDCTAALWARNVAAVKAAAEGAALRVVAFGAEAGRRAPDRLSEVLAAFSGGESVPLHCLGTNADGWPLHPLARGKWRVPDGKQPELWQVGRKKDVGDGSSG